MIKITEEEIKRAISESNSMSDACSKLKLSFSTYKRYAKKYNLYVTNQGSKGIKRTKESSKKYPLSDILNGKYPQYHTFKLKNRLLQEGMIENRCSKCNLEDWQGEELNCELDHIDGNKYNHSFTNLRMLCPNCHAQTPTYRSKKRL